MLSDHRPAELHGAKVGVASGITAGWYAKVGKLSMDEAKRRLDYARLPDPKEEASKIRAIFGPIADEILPSQEEFLNMTGRRFEDLKNAHPGLLGGHPGDRRGCAFDQGADSLAAHGGWAGDHR